MPEYQSKIDESLKATKDDIISFIQTLVQSPSLANDEGHVQNIIFEKLNQLGLATKKVPVHFDAIQDHPAFCDDGFSPDARTNVVGNWNNGKGRSLILNGHVDVIPTGAVAHGRGSCDMKAGLASGIFAIQVLQEIGFKPNGNVMVQSVVGEESGGCGTLTNIVKGYHGDGAVILEPTSLKMSPIQSGALTFRLTIPGRATHAAMRWDGVSAIEKFNLIHQSILDLEKHRHQSFEVRYYESPDRVAPINIGTIKGGEWHSTVPESVIAEGRFGVFPGETAQDARDAFESHIQNISNKDTWLKNNPPVIEWFEGQFESGQTPVDHPLIQTLTDSFVQTVGDAPILEGVTYGSDLRLFTNHAQIPAVLFGPGDVRLAHAANEFVEIEEVLTCINIMANMIINWCGGSIE